MKQYQFKILLISFFLLFVGLHEGFVIYAEEPINYVIKSGIQAGSGNFAPFYFTSMQHGAISDRPNSGYVRASVLKSVNNKKHFDYGFKADLITSYNNSSAFWIQQLYGEIKYRCLGLIVGNKEYDGVCKNNLLSSGGLVWSGNSRPLPQVKIGIFDFVAIPGTKGWIQVKGDISYGLFSDDKWAENNFGFINSFITTDVWFHQKKLFFRSKENMALKVTIGAEFAAQFGGKQRAFQNGVSTTIVEDKVTFKDLLQVIIPRGGGENSNPGDQAYYYGNHLGSWHGIFEYGFKNNSELKVYFEWLFDDASGMGKLNGWDGLWGVEYNTNRKSIVSTFLVEYLQTTNQGGPIHWAPNDIPGTEITSQATGADNYYNNFFYNGWAHYGMSNGSPLLKSPIYNKDGYLCFTDNRVQALHLGIKGNITNNISYIFKSSIRRGWGTPFAPLPQKSKAYSGFLSVSYQPENLSGWEFTGMIGIDYGNKLSIGNNHGFGLTVIKSGLLCKVRK